MPQKTFRLLLFIGLPLAVFCWILLMFASAGYQYESGKFTSMLFTLAIVLIFQFMVADPIKFVFQALWQTFVSQSPRANAFRYGIPRAKTEEDDIRFFKMRIEWGKSRLGYNWRHRDEALNLFYKNVGRDLILFGRFFISFIILIIILSEPLTYYHSDGLQKTFSVGRSSGRKVESFEDIDKLYAFIETNFIDVFDPLKNKGTITEELNWIPDEMSKMLGVVRIMQVRLKHRKLGLGSLTITHKKFLPGWKPYVDYPYTKKYWRTYQPWVAIEATGTTRYANTGYLGNYPTEQCYVTYLSRRSNSSRNILQYLRKENWVDRYTAALFFDLTVYNVDANLFGVCQVVAEFTPFGNILIYLHFESVNLLLNWNNTSKWYWIILLVYVFQLIYFLKTLVQKIYYGSIGSLLTFWNIMDWFIVLANILVFIFIYLREEDVVRVMNQFEMVSKQQFISFQSAINLDHYANVFLALLIFCATLRLWKVLLFARVFRLYVRTLQLGAADIFWALLNIMIFLIGLTISSYLINGTSRTQSHAPISLVHILSFSLGYSERVNPMEHSHIKTNTLGLIVYALMMFGVTLVLLNMLVTLICIHYSRAKEEERERPEAKINFWQFLKVEHSYIFNFFYKIRQRIKRKLRGKFMQEFHRNLLNVEGKLGIPQKKHVEDKPKEKAERQASRLRRLRIMTDILMTQTEILNRRIKDLNIRLDTDNM